MGLAEVPGSPVGFAIAEMRAAAKFGTISGTRTVSFQ